MSRHLNHIGNQIVIAGLVLAVSGTAPAAHAQKQALGTVIGAAAGGLLGSQVGTADSHRRHAHRRPDYRHRGHDGHRGHYRQRHHRRGYHERHYRHRRTFSYRYYPRRYDRPPHHYRGYSQHGHYRRGNETVRLVATATGVFFGALIGSEIGRYMDDVDQMRAYQANSRAQTAPIGQRIIWNNPASRNYGTVTPTRDGYSDSGRYCREFYQTVSIGGNTAQAYGVACRQPDGTWQIVQAQ